MAPRDRNDNVNGVLNKEPQRNNHWLRCGTRINKKRQQLVVIYG